MMKICHICNMDSGKHLLGCWSVGHIKDVEQQLAAANARIAELEATLNETYTDDFGTVWTRPTAWAYAAVCNANDKNRESKEQAEARCAAMRAVIEYLSMRYSICVQILPSGAWLVENKKQASEFAALENKP